MSDALNPLDAIEIPHTKRGSERYTALILAGTELFLTHGYEKVSLDDIVNHAGGSKASIYKYFGSKSGLFTAICKYRCQSFLNGLQPPICADNLELRTYLNQILHHIYQHLTEPDSVAFIRLFFEQCQHNRELAELLYEDGPHQAHKVIADALYQADLRNEIDCKRPYESALFFFGIFRNIEWRVLIGLPPIESDLNINEYIEYLVDKFLIGHKKA